MCTFKTTIISQILSSDKPLSGLLDTLERMGDLAREITIADLLDARETARNAPSGHPLYGPPSNASSTPAPAYGPGRPKPAKARAEAPVKAAKRQVKSHNLATPAGRADYDRDVLAVINQEHARWYSAAEINGRVGGTKLNTRTSLNRLIERGHATYQGKARATRYQITLEGMKAHDS